MPKVPANSSAAMSAYMADEGQADVSAFLKDLNDRYSSNDRGLIEAYERLYRVGLEDLPTLNNIERLKENNKRLYSAIVEVATLKLILLLSVVYRVFYSHVPLNSDMIYMFREPL